MKKIKLFLITLLCMVGVMNADAQGVVTWEGDLVEQKINTLIGGVIGANGDDRVANSWMSNASYDVVGNCLFIDSNGTASDAIQSYNTGLRFRVAAGNDINIRVFAPFGWEIEKFEFTASVARNNEVEVTYNDGKKTEEVTNSEAKRFFDDGVSSSSVKFTLHHDDWLDFLHIVPNIHTITFNGFSVWLKKVVKSPTEAINSVGKSTITRDEKQHWTWKQEIPVTGKSYKIVNGSSNDENLIVIAKKNNSTISGGDDSDGVEITDNIEEGGEWLLGSDYTLTNYTDEVVGFYQSHIDGVGFSETTQWRISALTAGGVSGFAISNKSKLTSLIKFSRSYLKLSETFESISGSGIFDLGTLGWEQDERDFLLIRVERPDNIFKNIFIWNFYSMDQYNCYIDYKKVFNEFMDLVPDESASYYDAFVALKNEVESYVAQGDTKENRDEAYEMIRRMLDMIATIRIEEGPDTPGDDKTGGLLNWGAEDGTNSWEYTTMSSGANIASTEGGLYSSTDYNGNANVHKFELKDIKMSQTVKGLVPGIYHVSVYWKANAGSALDFSAVNRYDKQSKTLDPVEEGATNSWKKYTHEVVVVDGELTVSASAKTSGKIVYLDDFSIEWYAKNYYKEDDATRTRIYKGIYNTKEISSEIKEKKDESYEKVRTLNTDAVAKVDTKYPFADIDEDLAFYGQFQFDNSENHNGLLYSKPYAITKYVAQTGGGAQQTPATEATNVIKNGVCAQLILENGYPFATKVDGGFTATSASYEMKSFGQGIAAGETGEQVYGTLMLPYVPATLPTGVKIYSISNQERGVLDCTPVSLANMQPNKPYLVKAPSKDAINMLTSGCKIDENLGAPVTDGALRGVYTRTEIEGDAGNYSLQVHTPNIGFYLVVNQEPASDDAVPTSGVFASPFRCYLHLDPVMNNGTQPRMVFHDGGEDDATGIVEIETTDGNGAVYDLSGRRVENVSRPGIYIMNGKKFMVK